MKKSYWSSLFAFAGAAGLMSIAACGGGGGGGGVVLYYPYKDLYGNVCYTFEATPGCTFLRTTGERIMVTEDPDYNRLWSVVFDSTGTYAAVYDQYNNFQGYKDVSEFSGYVADGLIGLGTTGLFWEDVRNGSYYWGKNGVLYSANAGEVQYLRAINNNGAATAVDTDMSALTSEANVALVDAATAKLVNEYNMDPAKARDMAETFNQWGVASASRGVTTDVDMNTTFRKAFKVDYAEAKAAVKAIAADSSDTQLFAGVNNRSAAANGILPRHNLKMLKSFYGKALASWGYDVNELEIDAK